MLWLDAMDTGTILAAGGGPISADTKVETWRDKSGRGNHAINATVNQQPTFRTAGLGSGKPALEFFDSLFNVLNITDNSSLDYSGMALYNVNKWKTNDGAQQALIAKYNTTGNLREFFQGINTTPNYIFTTSTDGTSGTATSLAVATVVGTTNPNIFTARWDGTTKSARLNSGTPATTNVSIGAQNVGITIGTLSNAAQPFKGYQSEILLFNQTMSSANDAAVMSYLTTKWAIP